jgi:tetratricopeptide (TPR) repeat protein
MSTTGKISNPKSAEDFMKNGWIEHTSDKEPFTAEQSFRQAITINPRLVDAHYGLGLALKAQGRKKDATQAFQTVIELTNQEIEDRGRAEMLRRLALGHINQLNIGDWSLEKEIWQHKQ